MNVRFLQVPLIAGILILLFSSCMPYNAVFYQNMEFPAWTDAHGVWSLSDERWFLREGNFAFVESLNFHTGANKKRDKNIIDKYYLNGALVDAGIRAKHESTHYSQNPYRIGLWVFGFPNKHTSFIINSISVSSRSGNDLSDLANNKLPVTIALEEGNSGDWGDFAWGYYHTEEIFNFRNEPVIIIFTLTINGIDKSESGHIAFEFKPERKFGLLPLFWF